MCFEENGHLSMQSMLLAPSDSFLSHISPLICSHLNSQAELVRVMTIAFNFCLIVMFTLVVSGVKLLGLIYPDKEKTCRNGKENYRLERRGWLMAEDCLTKESSEPMTLIEF